MSELENKIMIAERNVVGVIKIKLVAGLIIRAAFAPAAG